MHLERKGLNRVGTHQSDIAGQLLLQTQCDEVGGIDIMLVEFESVGAVFRVEKAALFTINLVAQLLHGMEQGLVAMRQDFAAREISRKFVYWFTNGIHGGRSSVCSGEWRCWHWKPPIRVAHSDRK